VSLARESAVRHDVIVDLDTSHPTQREETMRSRTSAIVNSLMTIFLASVAILFVMNLVRGDDAQRTPPTLPQRSGGNELRLPDPISASTMFDVDGAPYLAVMTKPGNDHVQSAFLRIVSVESGRDLEQIGRLHTSMSILTPPSAIAVAGEHVYVGLWRELDDTPALWVVDISNPRRPFEANLLRADAPIRSLAASGDGTLVASGFDGELMVYDLDRPNEPEHVSTVRTDDLDIADVGLSGSSLVTLGSTGVSIFDMSAPRAPALLSSITHPSPRTNIGAVEPGHFITGDEAFAVIYPNGEFLDLALAGERIALASGESGAILVEAPTPAMSETFSIDHLDIPAGVVRVALIGSSLYALSAEDSGSSESGVRFTLSEIDLGANELHVRDLREITGRPRFQKLYPSDDHVVFLFNHSIIRTSIPRD
jgi:hypothetical protein